MKGFGCDNQEAARNVVTEVTQASNGRWFKGLEIKGDNVARMKQTVGEIGWNKGRNGRDGDFVWLWLRKN